MRLFGIALMLAASAAAATNSTSVTFHKEVLPILQRNARVATGREKRPLWRS